MKIIAIDGAIGVGKSSTAHELSHLLGEDDTIISDEKIPMVLLEAFYNGESLSSLTLQNTILASRFINHLKNIARAKRENKKYVILDRSLVGDDVFARINILPSSKADYATYKKLNDEYSKFFKYDYHFYLTTNNETMLERIHQRHRIVEQNAENNYFVQIKEEHDVVFSNMKKIIVVDNSKTNLEATALKFFNNIVKRG